MRLKSKLREAIINMSGYYLYKRKFLPYGTDLFEDLKKINLEINTIFDIGANIGQSNLFFNRLYPKAKIFSFEPISHIYTELVKNTKPNKNSSCYNIAFSDKVENIEVKLFNTELSVLNTLNSEAMNHEENAAVEVIKTETIDNFLVGNSFIESVDLMKIDTEGYEIPILKGSLKSINRGKIKLIYVEVGFSRTNSRNTFYCDVQDFLEENGFTFFGLYGICEVNIRTKNHYGNALFIHDEHLKSIVPEF